MAKRIGSSAAMGAAVVGLMLVFLVQGSAAGFVRGKPLPLPKNPEAMCSKEAFHRFSVHNQRCARLFWYRQEPDDECCEGLADYFGADSIKPSANCFCVPSVWNWMTNTTARTNVRWETNALICSRKGYIIPYYVANGKGGYCNGTAPSNSTLERATLTGRGRSPEGYRGVDEWLGDLPKNGLVQAALGISIMSAIGFSLMMYPIMYELTMAAKESVFKR